VRGVSDRCAGRSSYDHLPCHRWILFAESCRHPGRVRRLVGTGTMLEFGTSQAS